VPGFAELVLFLIVVLVIFGAGKLPAIATAAGKAIQRMRSQAGQDEESDPEDDEESSA
jgi:TatA/E family protein of Tat protein translocase